MREPSTPKYPKESQELQEFADQLRADAVLRAKNAITNATDRACEVLRNTLDSDDGKLSLDAAKTYFKLLGMETQKVEHSGTVSFQPLNFGFEVKK